MSFSMPEKNSENFDSPRIETTQRKKCLIGCVVSISWGQLIYCPKGFNFSQNKVQLV
jgi:hypothetical protein